MPNFEVRISTPVELAGAKQLEQELTMNIGKAKALGQSFAELEAERNQVTASIRDATEEAKKGADKAIVSHRELREVVGGVGRAFGGLADVGLWMNPELAAVAAVLAAIELWKERVEEITQAHLQAAAAANELKLTNVAALGDAAKNAATQMADLARETEAMATAEAHSDTAMGNRIALLAAQMDAANKNAENDEKLAETEVDRQVMLGAITQEAAEVKKTAMREELQAVHNLNDTTLEQNKIAEEARKLAEARGRLPGETAAHAAAVAAGQEPARVKAVTDKRIEQLEAHLKELMDKDAALRTEHGELTGPMGWAKVLSTVTGTFKQGSLFGRADAVADLANTNVDMIKATQYTILHLKQHSNAEEEAAKNAQAHADELKKQLEKDQELNRLGDAAIAQLRALFGVHLGASTTAMQDAIGVNAARGPVRPGEARDNALEQGYEHGPRASADQLSGLRAAIITAQSNTRAHSESEGDVNSMLGEVVGLLNNVHGNTVQTRRELEQHRAELERLKMLIHNQRPIHS